MSQFSTFVVIYNNNTYILGGKCYDEKKNFKKIVSALLAGMLLFSCSACLFVTNAGAVTPRWVSILSMEVNIVFDGNEGEVLGIASKQSTASKIEGTVYLYKLVGDDWIYVDECYNIKTRGTLAVRDTFTCESGVTYKAVFVVTAYTGTTSETETVEYIDQCP